MTAIAGHAKAAPAAARGRWLAEVSPWARLAALAMLVGLLALVPLAQAPSAQAVNRAVLAQHFPDWQLTVRPSWQDGSFVEARCGSVVLGYLYSYDPRSQPAGVARLKPNDAVSAAALAGHIVYWDHNPSTYLAPTSAPLAACH